MGKYVLLPHSHRSIVHSVGVLPPTGRRISFRSAAAAETVQYLAAAMIKEAARAAQATDTAGDQQKNNKSNNYIGPPNYLALSSNTNN